MLTRRAADGQFWLAYDLVARLPQVHAAMDAGVLDEPRALLTAACVPDADQPDSDGREGGNAADNDGGEPDDNGPDPHGPDDGGPGWR